MKKKIEAKGTVEFERALEYFERALRHLKSGDLVLTQGSKSLMFRPEKLVEIEIELEEENGEQEFSFEMKWKPNMKAGKMPEFTLSSSSKRTESGEHNRDLEAGRGVYDTSIDNPYRCQRTEGSTESPESCSEA
jgi:amphi-Trp domain-containing protein